MNQLILASASPRRQTLLNQINIPHIVHPANIDETSLVNESATQLVARLAKNKAFHVNQHYNKHLASQSIAVLGADTIGVCKGMILNKPTNLDDAKVMLSLMSDNYHQILTAISLCYNGQQKTITQISRVKFRPISLTDIERYWQTGEPQDKAGSYAIQGIGAQFVESIEGSYSGIMGLPLFETCQLLNELGVPTITRDTANL